MNRERYRRSTPPMSVETTGKSVDEAVHAALARLHARRDEVDITVVQEGARGFLGLGAKEARVRVRRRESGGGRGDRGDRSDRSGYRFERSERGGDRNAERPERTTVRGRDSGGESGPRGGRMGGRRAHDDLDRLEEELRLKRQARVAGGQARASAPMLQGSSAGAGGSRSGATDGARGGSRGGPREGGRDRGRDSRAGAGRTGGRGGSGRRSYSESSGTGGAPRAAVEDRQEVPARSVATGGGGAGAAPQGLPDAARLADFTRDLLRKMGFEASVEAFYADEAYEVKIAAGDSDALLIGRKGETLDALQHVLAKMVSRGHEELLRVRVDVSEYRQRRSSELAERALAYAQQVRETGNEVVTEPLPAAERRIIHRTLSEVPDVTTQALGDGLIKRIWIGRAGEQPNVLAEPDMSYEPVDDAPVVEERQAPRREPRVPSGPAGEPLSLIDPWGEPPSRPEGGSSEENEEWGRRPKPARGRRR